MEAENFHRYEKKLWQSGLRNVLGIDEVGRGALAGPLVVGGVILDKKFDLRKERWVREVRDSKKLSPLKREELFKVITKHPLIYWEISKIFPQTIDKINILEAVKIGIKRLIKKISRKKKKGKIDFVILDGQMKIDLAIPYQAIVKADEKVLSCALASIIAKVKRDKMMINYHQKFQQFCFDKNKGYGTKMHFLGLRKIGPCPIHRQSFLRRLN
jgi:ribonuclease HII